MAGSGGLATDTAIAETGGSWSKTRCQGVGTIPETCVVSVFTTGAGGGTSVFTAANDTCNGKAEATDGGSDFTNGPDCCGITGGCGTDGCGTGGGGTGGDGIDSGDTGDGSLDDGTSKAATDGDAIADGCRC